MGRWPLLMGMHDNRKSLFWFFFVLLGAPVEAEGSHH